MCAALAADGKEDMSSNSSFFQLLGSFNLVDLDLISNALEQDPTILSQHNQNGHLPIQIAATRGHRSLIKLLVEHGADLEVTTKDGKTPVIQACQSGSLYAVHIFSQYGANMNIKDAYGRTLMHYAAIVGAVHTMHYLHVNCGMAYDQMDDEGYTPLHLSVWNNNALCVIYLLKKKRCSSVSVANRYGSTALTMAAKNGNFIIARELILSAKENLLTAKDGNGLSPVDHARQGRSPRHEELSVKMLKWTSQQLHTNISFIPDYETMLWYFVLCLPGSSLTLSCLIFVMVPYLWISIPLALLLIIVGFFAPMNNHRLPVDSALQNPAAIGALITGLSITLVCYFAVVWPRLWPGNWFWFLIVTFDYLAIIISFWKLEHTDPGFELVGKLNNEGHPMTIVDVARQEPNSLIQYSFCTACEIVLPEMTKHCKLCEHCCNGFDHHCLWLMKCIGSKNHRLFVTFLFLLSLDNFLFVRGGASVLIFLAGTYDPWIFLQYGMIHEKFLIFLITCNFLTGLFGMVNLLYQLSIISVRETTYFDARGTAAFGRKRKRVPISLSTRLRNLKMFFTNSNRHFADVTELLV